MLFCLIGTAGHLAGSLPTEIVAWECEQFITPLLKHRLLVIIAKLIFFSDIGFVQKLDSQREGKASFKLTGDYYNRSLSGWEPFLEPWG